VLNRRNYFIREHAGVFKLKNTYDILDPETRLQVGYALETTPRWILWLRLLSKQHVTPVSVELREQPESPPVLRIERGWAFFQSKVLVLDGQGNLHGYFKSKLFSLGGGFRVFNPEGGQVAEVKGSWSGWNFKFLSSSGEEIGLVTKEWAGFGRELFTTADNYLVAIHDMGAGQQASNSLLLAAGLAIDLVYNERRG
jgi:uncharacterized protein YxjI